MSIHPKENLNNFLNIPSITLKSCFFFKFSTFCCASSIFSTRERGEKKMKVTTLINRPTEITWLTWMVYFRQFKRSVEVYHGIREEHRCKWRYIYSSMSRTSKIHVTCLLHSFKISHVYLQWAALILDFTHSHTKALQISTVHMLTSPLYHGMLVRKLHMLYL